MDRICVHKITGKLLEMQPGGDDRPDLMEARLNTLKTNALAQGYKEDQIEVKWVTDKELAALTEPTASEKVAIENAVTKAKLAEIDAKSIRSMREWIAKQTDAPQFVKDFEAQAKAERAKLK